MLCCIMWNIIKNNNVKYIYYHYLLRLLFIVFLFYYLFDDVVVVVISSLLLFVALFIVFTFHRYLFIHALLHSTFYAFAFAQRLLSLLTPSLSPARLPVLFWFLPTVNTCWMLRVYESNKQPGKILMMKIMQINLTPSGEHSIICLVMNELENVCTKKLIDCSQLQFSQLHFTI